MVRERILVTGGTGRLGFSLVRALIKKGFRVRVLDLSLSKGRALFGKELENGNLDFVEADLIEGSDSDIGVALTGVSVVVHLAGLVDYSASEKKLLLVNYVATQRLVDLCRKHGVKKFVFAGSTSVNHNAKTMPITEDSILSPSNAYGRSKLLAEHAVKKSGLDYIILRINTVYGGPFKEGFCQVVDRVRDEKMFIIGSGKNRISLIHYLDVVSAFVSAVRIILKKNLKEIIIITGPDSPTQEECYKEIAKFFKVNPPNKHIPVQVAYLLAFFEVIFSKVSGKKPKFFLDYVRTLSEDRVFSIKKAKRILGWVPKISFRKGLNDFLKEAYC